MLCLACHACAQVLRVVLASGNLLNAGSHRGSAESIKLDVVMKLGDVKVTGTPPAAGAAAAEGAGGEGEASNSGLPPVAERPAHVRTLLEFVAWVVLRQAQQDGGGGGGGQKKSAALTRSARSGYLAEELGNLADAVRRMQTGEGRAGWGR